MLIKRKLKSKREESEDSFGTVVIKLRFEAGSNMAQELFNVNKVVDSVHEELGCDVISIRAVF